MGITKIEDLNEKEKKVVGTLSFRKWHKEMQKQFDWFKYGMSNFIQNHQPIVDIDGVKVKLVGESGIPLKWHDWGTKEGIKKIGIIHGFEYYSYFVIVREN